MGLVIRWVLDSWRNASGDLPLLLGSLLETLSLVNCAWLKSNPGAPGLYQAGLRYQREGLYVHNGKICPQEDWRDYPAILRHGGGDCEDLAAARVAELRVRYHVPARPIVEAQFVPQWCEAQTGRALHKDPALSEALARRLPPDKVLPPHWLYHIKVGAGTWREDPSRLLGMNVQELPNPHPEIP